MSFFEVELQNTASKAVSNENVPFHEMYLMIMRLFKELHGQKKIILSDKFTRKKSVVVT